VFIPLQQFVGYLNRSIVKTARKFPVLEFLPAKQLTAALSLLERPILLLFVLYSQPVKRCLPLLPGVEQSSSVGD
jgi:hypothetical protein